LRREHWQSDNRRVVSDDLREAEEHIRTGELKGALAALDRAEMGFKKAKDISGLRSVLKLAKGIEPLLASKRERTKAEQIVYAASQNIRHFERQQALGRPGLASPIGERHASTWFRALVVAPALALVWAISGGLLGALVGGLVGYAIGNPNDLGGRELLAIAVAFLVGAPIGAIAGLVLWALWAFMHRRARRRLHTP
jgi:hypothetical protein